jgi:hypothetical protein
MRFATSGAPSCEHHSANRRLFSSYHSTVLSLRFFALQEARNSSLKSSTVLGATAIGRRAGRAILSSSGLGHEVGRLVRSGVEQNTGAVSDKGDTQTLVRWESVFRSPETRG